MAFDIAAEYVKAKGFGDRIMQFEVSSATVELAAVAVGCEPAMIAKTLSFMVNGKAILIVAAGDAKIDNPKYKAFFATKAKMLSAEEVDEMIGHSVGGVCPFGIGAEVDVYLDISLKRFEIIYPACGNAASAVRLSCEELETCCGTQFKAWIDVCKGWQEEQEV